MCSKHSLTVAAPNEIDLILSGTYYDSAMDFFRKEHETHEKTNDTKS